MVHRQQASGFRPLAKSIPPGSGTGRHATHRRVHWEAKTRMAWATRCPGAGARARVGPWTGGSGAVQV